MSNLRCNIFHETDGQCCGEGECFARKTPPIVRANANLSLWHMAGLMVAIFSIYGWGLYTLDRALARDQPAIVATTR